MSKVVTAGLLLWCYVCVTVAQDPTTVDEYVAYINSFIDNATRYTYPTDSTAYLQGNPVPTLGCRLSGIYDFIIVGAGSTGTVLARRLSEDAKSSVLLIEAGGEENAMSDIPGYEQFLIPSDLNWGYNTVAQTNSLQGFIDNQERVPRGKVLGGSSVLNAMMYVRGNAIDYDRWAEQGNPGWAYRDVLPYFKKSEHANLTDIDREYHGFDGPLNVERINILSPLTQAFLDANEELGRPVLDYNGKSENGFSLLQVTEKNGRRFSGNRAFLQPVKNRKNLKILTNALVTKLLFRGNIAEGVKYLQGGHLHCAKARKEITLSAGAINSPQLLMLAGIGPGNHLKEHKIQILKDLPGVGQNLWDHLMLNQFPFTTNYSQPSYTQRQQVAMYLNGSGPLTAAVSIQDVGFVHLLNNDTSPDVEHIFSTTIRPNMSYATIKQIRNLKEEVYDAIYKPLTGATVWSSFAMLLHPKSRGSVRLKSKNPLDFPLIDANYLSDPDQVDLKTLVAALKDMIRISNTKAMQRFDSQMFPIQLAACKYAFGTDAYFECLIKQLANSIWHWSGSCKMGPKVDKMAVVDEQLFVHGVRRLRVADCSVIPVTIAGHPNAVAYMIGEKAADMIKKYHNMY